MMLHINTLKMLITFIIMRKTTIKKWVLTEEGEVFAHGAIPFPQACNVWTCGNVATADSAHV